MTDPQGTESSRTARRSAFLVLVRHFFERLFQNDSFPFGDQLKQKLYALFALLAVLGGHVANSVFFKYLIAVPDYGRSWVERCEFLTLFMLLLAFAVVLEWDMVFLDKRDYSNLMSLPLRPRTIFGAKFVSFLGFVLMYTAAVNALAVLVVAIYLAQWKSNGLGVMIRAMGAHFLSAAAANLTVFFFIVFLQAVLLLALSPSLFRRLSILFRFAALTVIIFLLMMSLFSLGSWREAMVRVADQRASSSLSVLAFPPMWFIGLNEVLLGSRNPLDRSLALVGALAPLVLALFYFLAMRLSFNKHLSRSSEIPARSSWPRKLGSALGRAFDAVALRDPVQRAVFHFVGATLRASALHKIRLVGYLAAASGLSLIVLNLPAAAGLARSPLNRNALAVPLILSFFVLAGFRSLVDVPLTSDANWVFELTEKRTLRPYFVAVKKAVLFLVVIPLFAALFPFYAFAWGMSPALLHLAFGLVCSLGLLEILFFKYPKIPFACSPAPGRAPLHFLWLAYVLGFQVYAVWMNGLEKELFRNPSDFVAFFVTAGILLAALWIYQEAYVFRRLRLVYREEPVPALITFPTND